MRHGAALVITTRENLWDGSTILLVMVRNRMMTCDLNDAEVSNIIARINNWLIFLVYLFSNKLLS